MALIAIGQVAASALAGVSELMARLLQRPRGTGSPRASATIPLDQINAHFHSAYERARDAAQYDGPVFVVLADDLIVFRGEQREVLSFSPRSFHVIKSVAHAPVALYAMLVRPEPASQAELEKVRARVASALEDSSMRDAELDDARSDLILILQGCADLIDCTVREGSNSTRLAAFAAEMGPPLLRLAQEATRVQLAALHGHSERALAALSPAQRARLQVVVAGDHQARVRSLAMQYFRKRFAEPSDADEHVTYAEGVRDEKGALTLVGTQRLDRAIAQAFFAEEKRLQRDILGDAAESQLHSLSLTKINV